MVIKKRPASINGIKMIEMEKNTDYQKEALRIGELKARMTPRTRTMRSGMSISRRSLKRSIKVMTFRGKMKKERRITLRNGWMKESN